MKSAKSTRLRVITLDLMKRSGQLSKIRNERSIVDDKSLEALLLHSLALADHTRV